MTTLTNAILALACGLPLAAQQQTPSPAQRFAELQTGLVKEVTGWLRSDDLATVAWGAHAAATFGLTECAPDLQTRLAALAKVEPQQRQFVVLAILDALIQRDIVVPGELLAPFLEGPCLEPALVLLARRPQANRAFFLQAFRDRIATSDPAWRVCGNLLAAEEDPEFVLDLLRTPVTLSVAVTAAGDEPEVDLLNRGTGFLTSLLSIPAGYPPVALYALHEQDGVGFTLLANGPVPVFVHRTEHRGRTITHCVIRSFDAAVIRRAAGEQRTVWLAAMLGPQARSQRFDFELTCGLEWSAPAAFVEAVQARKAVIAGEHRALVAECVELKIVTAAAAATLSPAIAVEVHDQRKDQSTPLPDVNGSPK